MKLSEKIYVRTIALLVILIIAMLVVAVAFAVAGECDKNATKTETVVEHSQQRFQRVKTIIPLLSCMSILKQT